MSNLPYTTNYNIEGLTNGSTIIELTSSSTINYTSKKKIIDVNSNVEGEYFDPEIVELDLLYSNTSYNGRVYSTYTDSFLTKNTYVLSLYNSKSPDIAAKISKIRSVIIIVKTYDVDDSYESNQSISSCGFVVGSNVIYFEPDYDYDKDDDVYCYELIISLDEVS